MNNDEFQHLALSYIDLLSERYGGQALFCNDEFFAEANNMVKQKEPVFIEDKYTDRGKWMDGWESRRRRTEGFDWCVLRLGIAGVIKGVNVDTTFFRGNAPESIALEVCNSQQDPDDNTQWHTLIAKSKVQPHSHNYFEVESFEEQNESVWTHLRLSIFPDGGVARLRVYGEARFEPATLLPNELVDLAAATNGARAIACSDMFFSPMNNLIQPGRGVNMGDGWETRRRRGPGFDWSVIKLACSGSIVRAVIDTCHFKGNYPDRFSLEATTATEDEVLGGTANWTTLISETKLHAHREHVFENELNAKAQSFSYVRLNIFPDGGVSRLRLWGYPSS